jgi:hypothetical protein
MNSRLSVSTAEAIGFSSTETGRRSRWTGTPPVLNWRPEALVPDPLVGGPPIEEHQAVGGLKEGVAAVRRPDETPLRAAPVGTLARGPAPRSAQRRGPLGRGSPTHPWKGAGSAAGKPIGTTGRSGCPCDSVRTA